MGLMEEWKNERNYSPFVNDGILDEEKWAGAFPKIMFFLKESYKNSDWYDIAGHPITLNSKKVFWRNVARWKFLINGVFNNHSAPDFPKIEDIPDFQNGKLDDIAYVNVSKALGESTSNDKNIQNIAIKDKAFLTRQIDAISPNIVLCCKTFWSYHPIYNGNVDTKKISERIHVHGDRIIINFFHPGAPGGMKEKSLYQELAKVLTAQGAITLFSEMADKWRQQS